MSELLLDRLDVVWSRLNPLCIAAVFAFIFMWCGTYHSQQEEYMHTSPHKYEMYAIVLQEDDATAAHLEEHGDMEDTSILLSHQAFKRRLGSEDPFDVEQGGLLRSSSAGGVGRGAGGGNKLRKNRSVLNSFSYDESDDYNEGQSDLVSRAGSNAGASTAGRGALKRSTNGTLGGPGLGARRQNSAYRSDDSASAVSSVLSPTVRGSASYDVGINGGRGSPVVDRAHQPQVAAPGPGPGPAGATNGNGNAPAGSPASMQHDSITPQMQRSLSFELFGQGAIADPVDDDDDDQHSTFKRKKLPHRPRAPAGGAAGGGIAVGAHAGAHGRAKISGPNSRVSSAASSRHPTPSGHRPSPPTGSGDSSAVASPIGSFYKSKNKHAQSSLLGDSSVPASAAVSSVASSAGSGAWRSRTSREDDDELRIQPPSRTNTMGSNRGVPPKAHDRW